MGGGEGGWGGGGGSPPPHPYNPQNSCTPLGVTHWLAAAPVVQPPPPPPRPPAVKASGAGLPFRLRAAPAWPWPCPSSPPPPPTAGRPGVLGPAADSGRPFGTLFIVEAQCARTVDAVSTIPDEEEVLFTVNSQFRVIKCVAGGAIQLLEHAMEVDLSETMVYELHQVQLQSAQVCPRVPLSPSAPPIPQYPPPPPRDALEGEGTSEAAPEALRQAVGGGCRSGLGRLLSVTNAIEVGTWSPSPKKASGSPIVTGSSPDVGRTLEAEN